MLDKAHPDSAGGGRVDRSLRRLLKKPEVARNVLPLLEDPRRPRAVTDNAGQVLAGDPAAKSGPSTRISLGDDTLGFAWGDGSDDIARTFGALAAQDREIRALGRESLEKYREITMLYSLAEKIIGAPDPTRIANIVCEEALRFLRCDSAALLMLNPATNRLEIIANRGKSFHDRATRDVGDDVIGRILGTGMGEIVNELGAAAPLEATNALTSVVVAPLRTNEKTFGALVAGSEVQRHFNASDLQVLNAVAAHAAAAIEVDRLNRDLAETERKPPDLIYGVNEVPPLGTSLLLAAQHAFVAMLSLSYPVLIVLEAGGDRMTAASVVSMTLIGMGIGTLLQARIGPPLGSGLFAPHVPSSIYAIPAIQAMRLGGTGLLAGMIMTSGVFSLVFSRVLRRFRWLFPPELSGVIVLMVGLSLAQLAAPMFVGLSPGDAVSTRGEIAVALLTLGTIMVFTVAPVGRARLYAPAIGFVLGYGASAWLGLFDDQSFGMLGDLPLFGLHVTAWTLPRFDVALLLPFLVAALATNIKDAGFVISVQKTNDANWTRPDTRSLSAGIVATGLGNMAGGAIGGVATTVSASNVSLASATGATSRHLGLYVALMFFVMAMLPKFNAMMALVPIPVLGAGLVYFASHLISSGFSLIASRMLDARRNLVVGIPLLAGVGLIARPDLVAGAPDWVAIVASSPLALATLIALALNILLNAGVSNHASTGLRFDETLAEYVNRFVSRQGASWGARGEVVRRAAPAITDWCEELRQTLGSDSAALDLQFDDFRLTATIRDLDEHGGRAAAENETLGAIDRAARNISRRYGCGVKLNTVREIVFDFEH
ncbi:GAF domain-containing protein [Rhodobacteraceae bacterium 2CG4]|uniref:GAF domain-containing protein n=1 Tax=Halovulum marinum TaxID=2662447 RepID=A0A6L5YYA0_9RHOB|nr:solute carrier family 23 protein [Halovulum marinum]MSU89178.1 GAF domain-containing protein [Halovulum marinum]